MTKILLVEDDKSLREIYGVRLLAEGYDIVSADNGEEALAVAIKERPNLIITDVMMPKISGFDMLDILRSTTETRDIKVIMMTALGSDENRERSERLGADRYLVKSQVGIEDVVRAVHDLLGDTAQAGAPGAVASASPAPAAPAVTAPASNGRALVSAPAVAAPGAPANQVPIVQPLQSPAELSAKQGQASPAASDSPSRRARVIQPINDPSKSIDLQALVDKELAKEGSGPIASEAQQRQVVENQLDTFMNTPAPTPTNSSPANDLAATPIPIVNDAPSAAAPILPPAAPAASTPAATSAPAGQLPPVQPPAAAPPMPPADTATTTTIPPLPPAGPPNTPVMPTSPPPSQPPTTPPSAPIA